MYGLWNIYERIMFGYWYIYVQIMYGSLNIYVQIMYTPWNIYVQVMYGPSWVVEPTDQAGQEREQVQLICLADSNPNPR